MENSTLNGSSDQGVSEIQILLDLYSSKQNCPNDRWLGSDFILKQMNFDQKCFSFLCNLT